MGQPINQTAGTGMEEPTGLKASKGIELLTGPTPNGFKASILLEELKEAYPSFTYTWQGLDISKNTQKHPWFTALGPNGRIPVIHDHDRSISVMEGAAILTYLTRHFDPDAKFHFKEDPELADQEQWIAWQHGGLGPMQGQANHFFRYAPERIPYATQRYVGEAERLYGVLNTRLRDRDFIAGSGRGRYSIADMACLGWVNAATMSGLTLDESKFGEVKKWLGRCMERPATRKGFAIPKEGALTVGKYDKVMQEDEEVRKREEGFHEHLRKAQEKYNYKYQTP